jgi:hypothetical protein
LAVAGVEDSNDSSGGSADGDAGDEQFGAEVDRDADGEDDADPQSDVGEGTCRQTLTVCAFDLV